MLVTMFATLLCIVGIIMLFGAGTEMRNRGDLYTGEPNDPFIWFAVSICLILISGLLLF